MTSHHGERLTVETNAVLLQATRLLAFAPGTIGLIGQLERWLSIGGRGRLGDIYIYSRSVELFKRYRDALGGM
jgi:hypothetical protein